MAKTPYDTDLDRNAANFQPLTPLTLLERAVGVLKPIDAHWHYAWCELAIGKIHAAKGDLERAAAGLPVAQLPDRQRRPAAAGGAGLPL